MCLFVLIVVWVFVFLIVLFVLVLVVYVVEALRCLVCVGTGCLLAMLFTNMF